MGYKNSEQRKSYARQWKAARRSRYLTLRGNKCEKCASTIDLEFHHRNRDEKVSHRIFSWSIKRLEEELDKCDLLCSTCHKVETAKERNYYQAPHGSLTAYKRYNCRCLDCKKANSDYEYNRRKVRTYEAQSVVTDPVSIDRQVHQV